MKVQLQYFFRQLSFCSYLLACASPRCKMDQNGMIIDLAAGRQQSLSTQQTVVDNQIGSPSFPFCLLAWPMILDSPITRIHSSNHVWGCGALRAGEVHGLCLTDPGQDGALTARKTFLFCLNKAEACSKNNNALFILGHTVFFVCSLAQESYIFPITAYGEMEYKRTACETRVVAKTHRSNAFLRVM